MREEMRRQPGNVGAPLAQRRKLDRDEVQAIEQILAELAAGDELVKRPIRCRDHAHVDGARSARSEDLVGAVLEHAQQFHLRGRIDLADLVEKDRAAVGDFEAALAILPRVGERAAHVAEHLALEQRRRNPAEVHFDERAAAAAAVGVDRFGDELLCPCRFRP